MTMTEQAPRKEKRIARFLLPKIDPQSEILPDDKWIKDNVRDILKTNKTVRSAALRAAASPFLAAAATVLGVAAGIAAFPAAVFGAGIAAAFFAHKSRQAFASFKKDALPELQAEVQVRYLKLKGQEIARAWKEEMDRRKSEAPAQEIPATPKPAPKTAASAAKGKKGFGAIGHIFARAQRLKTAKGGKPQAPAHKPPAP